MPARVTLKVVRGPRKGKEYVFEERTTCIMGRAKDCHPRIPAKKNKATVSRYHCLFDINPPDIRIRDFGSRNGTFINGEIIGKREPDEAPSKVDWAKFRERDLQHGDTIRVGDTILEVDVFVPVIRSPPPTKPLSSPRVRPKDYSGPARQPPIEARLESVPATGNPCVAAKVCTRCDRDVSGEITDGRHGDYVCAACRSDPFELMKLLLQEASRGDQEAICIQGYRIIRELGRGGMGAVSLAQHETTGGQVALKVMLPEVAADDRAVERFLREITNTKALDHPHVVRLYESGCSWGTFFFTLEFCEGGSVANLMKHRCGRLGIDEAGPIILQSLDGLAYAHSAKIPEVRLRDRTIGEATGLVHRDIKPHNLFLTGPQSERITKIGDYGLAKAFDLAGFSGHTFTGSTGGTPYFMPRQQVINFLEAGPEVDVWAMAATLYNMLTGQVPRDFTRDDMDVWQIVLRTQPTPIRDREPTIPKRLAEVIDYALRDDPEIGFQTALELKRALEQVL